MIAINLRMRVNTRAVDKANRMDSSTIVDWQFKLAELTVLDLLNRYLRQVEAAASYCESGRKGLSELDCWLCVARKLY